MRVTFLGFGLIAGSVARALRAGVSGITTGGADTQARSTHQADHPTADAWHLTAWSPSGRGPGIALGEGVIDRVAGDLDEAIERAELIVLAGPPDSCVALLAKLADVPLRSSPTITDVASTKVRLVREADRLGLPFVGGHPMAGREVAGYEGSVSDLFVGRPWVLVPGSNAGPLDVERVERLARATGARPVHLDAATHDAATAAISHLPLLLAAALVETVAGRAGPERREGWSTASALAASGWRDMTRLARGDPAMGGGILGTNAVEVLRLLDALDATLAAWRGELTRGDSTALAAHLAAVRARLEESP